MPAQIYAVFKTTIPHHGPDSWTPSITHWLPTPPPGEQHVLRALRLWTFSPEGSCLHIVDLPRVEKAGVTFAARQAASLKGRKTQWRNTQNHAASLV